MFSQTVVSFLLMVFCCATFAKQVSPKSFSVAGFYPVEGSHRSVASFNPGWRFYKGDADGAQYPVFDDSNWAAANLPHGLEVLGKNASGGRNYQGKAWYRKKFDLAKHNGNVFLYFEAVMGETKVWVNGQHMIDRYGGYLPFVVNITDVLNKNGKENVVAVMTDNSDNDEYLPGRPQSRLDFTYMGGIYRDTYIIETDSVYITFPELSQSVAGGGVFAATLDVNENSAELAVRTEIKNDSNKTQRLTVVTTLEDRSGRSIKRVEQQLELEPGKAKQLNKQFTVENVALWHPDDPQLHFLHTQLFDNDKELDSLKTRIGIRLFEMRGAEGLFVNKKWIGYKVIGANRHQDYTYVGNALPNSGQWRDVKLLREGGSRIIRAGHYPMDPAFYDACDELGVLTTTANPGWQFYNNKSTLFETRLYKDTRDLVRRDRNVASILMWETALNETRNQPGHVMNTMHNIAHEEYPFPGMYTVTDMHEAKSGGLDIYYNGMDDHVNSFYREYGDGWEVDNWSSQNAKTRINMQWGERALLEAALRETKYLNDSYGTPKVRFGAAVWAGIDHQRGYHPDPFWGGLLNGLRLPKYTYQMYKSQYDAHFQLPGIKTGPMLFIANELTQASPKDIVIFSNVDEIKLFWLGKEVASQKPSTDVRFSQLPHPPFIFNNVFDFDVVKSDWRRKTHEVQLRADGYIDNKLVISKEKDYAERTSGLVLDVDFQGVPLVADGADFVPVRATVVDANGTKKVLADERVFFHVEGPAKIIGGLTNGANPAETEMGVATALLRATTQPGTIRVTAHVDGLKSDTITIKSILSSMPLVFDMAYYRSAKSASETTLIIKRENEKENNSPSDVKALKQALNDLRQQLVGKEQDIMELRGQLGNK